MLIPILAIALGSVGLLVCAILFLGLRTKAPKTRDTESVPPTDLNKEIDLPRYKATGNPILHLDKGLPDHPFKIGDGGVFCSVCLINTNLKRQTEPVMIHSHECPVIRKVWKIMICRDGDRAEYFVSLDRAHLKRAA